MRIAPASAYRPVRERLAQRVDAAADALLRLEDERIVAGAQQLVGGHQAGHAGADDHDPLARAGHRRQAFLNDANPLGAYRIHAVSPARARMLAGPR